MSLTNINNQPLSEVGAYNLSCNSLTANNLVSNNIIINNNITVNTLNANIVNANTVSATSVLCTNLTVGGIHVGGGFFECDLSGADFIINNSFYVAVPLNNVTVADPTGISIDTTTGIITILTPSFYTITAQTYFGPTAVVNEERSSLILVTTSRYGQVTNYQSKVNSEYANNNSTSLYLPTGATVQLQVQTGNPAGTINGTSHSGRVTKLDITRITLPRT